ncbi:MAG: hypothetical protein AAF513_07840 [Pseudomonadota bacterium]
MSPTAWLYVAAALAAFTAVVHVLGGGRSAARPLLDSALADEPKYTNYYCWHMVSIIIAFMAACFALSAARLASIDLAIGATLLAVLFAAWSLLLIVWKRQPVMRLPQWILFLPIALTGALGVL